VVIMSTMRSLGPKSAYPRIASDHVTISFRISSATTVNFQKQLCLMTIQRTFPNFLSLPDVLLEHNGNGRKQTGVIIWYDLAVPLSNKTSRGWGETVPCASNNPLQSRQNRVRSLSAGLGLKAGHWAVAPRWGRKDRWQI
jgi:hypothetical protein